MTRKSAIGLIRAAALAAALFIAGGALPFVGVVAMVFAPAPVLGYAVGRTAARWRSIGAVLVCAIFIGIGAGPLQAIGYLCTLGLATALIAEMLEREQSFETIVLVTTAAVAVAGGVCLLVQSGSPAALADSLRDSLSQALTRSESVYRMMGAPPANEDAEVRAKLLDLTVRLSPAFAVMGVAATVLANLGLFWRWLGSERLKYQLFAGLVRWKAPEWIIWLLIAFGFTLFAPFAAMRDFAIDAFICVAAVYFWQGIAIMAFYFRMLSMPLALRGIVYFVVFAQPILAAVVCAMGIFDMWIDFRRLKPPSQEAGSFGDFF